MECVFFFLSNIFFILDYFFMFNDFPQLVSKSMKSDTNLMSQIRIRLEFKFVKNNF